jgi:hypothetical protein
MQDAPLPERRIVDEVLAEFGIEASEDRKRELERALDDASDDLKAMFIRGRIEKSMYGEKEYARLVKERTLADKWGNRSPHPQGSKAWFIHNTSLDLWAKAKMVPAIIGVLAWAFVIPSVVLYSASKGVFWPLIAFTVANAPLGLAYIKESMRGTQPRAMHPVVGNYGFVCMAGLLYTSVPLIFAGLTSDNPETAKWTLIGVVVTAAIGYFQYLLVHRDSR